MTEPCLRAGWPDKFWLCCFTEGGGCCQGDHDAGAWAGCPPPCGIATPVPPGSWLRWPPGSILPTCLSAVLAAVSVSRLPSPSGLWSFMCWSSCSAYLPILGLPCWPSPLHMSPLNLPCPLSCLQPWAHFLGFTYLYPPMPVFYTKL